MSQRLQTTHMDTTTICVVSASCGATEKVTIAVLVPCGGPRAIVPSLGAPVLVAAPSHGVSCQLGAVSFSCPFRLGAVSFPCVVPSTFIPVVHPPCIVRPLGNNRLAATAGVIVDHAHCATLPLTRRTLMHKCVTRGRDTLVRITAGDRCHVATGGALILLPILHSPK